MHSKCHAASLQLKHNSSIWACLCTKTKVRIFCKKKGFQSVGGYWGCFFFFLLKEFLQGAFQYFSVSSS